MTKLPRITGQEIISAPAQLGFKVVRIMGSHHFLSHPDSRATVIPVHSGEIIGPGLMMKILHDCKLSRVDFLKLFS